MFALSTALLTLALLAFQGGAATFIWSTCAIGSLVAMVVYWRNRAHNEVTLN